MTRARDLADSADKDIAGTLTLDGLQIDETAAAGTGILLTNDNNTSGTYSDIKWQYSSADPSYGSGIRFKQVDTTHGGQLEFFTDSSTGTYTQRMAITEDGNVGIGRSPTAVSSYKMLELDGPSGGYIRNYVNGTFTGYWYTGSGASGFGTATSTPLTFDTSNSERMRIDSSGNVGIGTTSPSHKLDVLGTGQVTGGNSAGIDTRFTVASSGNGGSGRGVGLVLSPAGSSNSVEAVRLVGFQNTAASTANNAAFAVQVSNTSGSLTERMRIDSSGSVGIGSTNPIGSAQRLYIDHPAGVQTALPTVKIRRANNVGGGSAIDEIGLDVSVPSSYNNAYFVYGIKTYARHNLFGRQIGIYSEVGEANSDNSVAGYFKGGHSDTNGISKPRIVYIQQTTTVGASNSGYSIGCYIKQDNYTKNEFMRWDTDYSGSDTMNALRILRNGSQIGGITTTTSSTSYNTSSDYRLKENVTDVTDGITRVKQLAPKRFNFIAEPDKVVDGFIAHEAQAVVPEAVTGTQDAMSDEAYEVTAALGEVYTPATDDADEVIHSTDVAKPETLADGQFWRETTAAVMGTRSVPDYQGIDQSKLVPLLTAALQEAIAKIETLETKVAALEGA